uniref:Uncharacterized protein n=1 Tax=Poecilia mexicana TaxID=48701 RepID=A0A3B3WQI0_9TELE
MSGVNHQPTNPHTTLSASQSMTFSLGGVTPGGSVAMPTMPHSRSQQKAGIGSQGSLGSTWSDPSVNISLDFLSAGLNHTKTPPSLNNIIQQQVPPVSLLAQSFGGLTLSSPPHVAPIRPPANPIMAGGAMAMGMPAPLGMGVPGVGMGLSHSISPAVVPPKQDAFANFGSFGK